jgi:anti-anti-sigma regulatory factor
MDEDNPTLREWCLLIVRNLCASSEKIRSELEKLKLVDISEEGKKTLERLGMKEVYEQEMKKLMRKDENKRQFSKI